jgi:hypothetical protein
MSAKSGLPWMSVMASVPLAGWGELLQGVDGPADHQPIGVTPRNGKNCPLRGSSRWASRAAVVDSYYSVDIIISWINQHINDNMTPCFAVAPGPFSTPLGAPGLILSTA